MTDTKILIEFIEKNELDIHVVKINKKFFATVSGGQIEIFESGISFYSALELACESWKRLKSEMK